MLPSFSSHGTSCATATKRFNLIFQRADAVVPQQGSLFDGLCTNNEKDGLVLDLSKISVPPALISASVS